MMTESSPQYGWSGGQRLFGEDVEARAGDGAGTQRLDERVVVDDLAASDVDQAGRRAHGGQRGAIDQVMRVRA